MKSQRTLKVQYGLPPLLGKSRATGLDVYERICKISKNSLFIIGTTDPYYDKSRIAELRKPGTKFVSISGADHSMEIERGYMNSLKVLERITKEVERFLE